MKNKYHFFYKSKLSNWNMSTFTVDGITYNCGEQYMMYQKAITFNDTNTAKLILESTSPREQKNLGRQVKNYDDSIWSQIRFDVVKKGLKERFKQNPILKEELLKHKGKELVEASPIDRIWGIGYDEDNAIQNFNDWGENLLGKILTELITELK